MTNFKAKMHQIRFRLGGGAYSAPPDPLAAFKGPTSRGRGGIKGKGRVGRGSGGEGKKGGEGPHTNGGTWAPSYLATLLFISNSDRKP